MLPAIQNLTIIPQNWHGSSWWNRFSKCLACNNGVTAGTGYVTIQNDTIDAAPWVMVGYSKRLLPVTLIEFTARLKDGTVISNWATSSEINNKFFTLEKSKDGKIFEEVGRVDGAGNSTVTHYYHYMDNSPFGGLSYYRLKQTDYNGAFTFSDLVPVFNKDNNSSWYIFPNPAKDQIRIASASDDLSNATFRLFNLEGSLVKTVAFSLKNQSIFTVDLNGVSNGIYVGKIADDFHQQVFKIVKN